ncbi:MAG: peptidase T [Salibacteraceae bacterium]
MKISLDKPSFFNRFEKYARIDTQSDPHSNSVPSTEQQKNLGRLLEEELREMGLADAEMDALGYVYATLPSNRGENVPVICFCAHMDTSPETSGENVNPLLHLAYDGKPIVLKNGVTIDPADHTELKRKKGMDVITADGTTLLGADNKAGITAIMEAVRYLTLHPEIPHGTIKVLFTPDEEIGRGADHVDLTKLGAQYGYTVDGEALGSLEDETFCADQAVVTFKGVNAHPGFAKGKMINAVKVAAAFLASLPDDTWSPETTEDREGFVHPYEITGGVEACSITFILRSFEESDLKSYAKSLEKYARKACRKFGGSSYEIAIKEQYRNMKYVLQQHPEVVDYAAEAIRRAGLVVRKRPIRGGTDGAKLSYMGLPCANIFAGEYAFHSLEEWTTLQDMMKSAETLIHLAVIWAERNGG